jgi:hypothetical protein
MAGRRGFRVSSAILMSMVLTTGAALAGSQTIDMTVPPIARAQAERIAVSTTTTPDVPRFEPAPLPNQDLVAPHGREAPPGPAIGAGLFRQKSGYRGDGYVQGSTPSQTEQPKRLPLPGIMLTVPLN